MDIGKLILKTLEKKKAVRTSEIVARTGFSRTYINRFFQQLRDEGKIVLIGRANRARYVLAGERDVVEARKGIRDITYVLKNEGLSEDKVLVDIKRKTGIFDGLRENVSNILDYAFSEMLNNAIEHSGAKTIKVVVKRDARTVFFSVMDKGVGIFNNIVKTKKLDDSMAAIQDLLKGKQTTDPAAHSGEGVFFTSKAADIMMIRGEPKKLIFDNLVGDVFIRNAKGATGTRVNFSIAIDSKKDLSAIFKRYSDTSFEFDKTSIAVRLYKIDTQYISRSQARRIVSGLDEFKKVILDFKGVETVGQGFADEVFRVWALKHTDISVVPRNMNKNVEFMINRAKKVIGTDLKEETDGQ